MGHSLADSDSGSFDEKGQTTTVDKRSRCPLVSLLHVFTRYRERRDRRRIIDQKREEVEKDQQIITRQWDKLKTQSLESADARHAAWMEDVNSNPWGFSKCTLSKSHRYKIIRTDYDTGTIQRTAVHDLRTSEGREEAFKFWEETYHAYATSYAAWNAKLEQWHELYLTYTKSPRPGQERKLLSREYTVRWCRLIVQQLPN